MVLEARLQLALLLKTVVDAINDLCKAVSFDFAEKGLQVQSMNRSHVALVLLLLREFICAEFMCARPATLGVYVELLLSELLKMFGSNVSLKFRWQDGAATVSFQCAGDDDCIAEFGFILMQIENEHREFLEQQQHKITVKLSSSEFQKICRDVKAIGEMMQFQRAGGSR